VRRAKAISLASHDGVAATQEFDAAVALFEKTGSRVELARTLIDRGLHRTARGEMEEARLDLTRAREIAAACGARPDQAKAAAALTSLTAASASPPHP
jgi:hypothetical protein